MKICLHAASCFGASGRISFYDEYGVIRDVLQNHLTEVMTLLTMKLPANVSNSGEVLQNKLEVLSSMLPLGKSQAVIGQYQNYKTEVQQELNKTKEHVSMTSTFAGEHTTFFHNITCLYLWLSYCLNFSFGHVTLTNVSLICWHFVSHKMVHKNIEEGK